MAVINDSVKIKRAKAFDKSYNWIRDQVRQGKLILIHIISENNIADYITKSLQKAEHERQVVKLVTYPPKKHKKVPIHERVC